MSETVLPSTGCPSCGGKAEPEEEDGLHKYVCTLCDYEFGFTLQPRPEPESDWCQLGIPEEARRRSAVPVVPAHSAIFLGKTIPRRPE